MRKSLVLIVFFVLALSIATAGWGMAFSFTTGNPDGRMGAASRPSAPGQVQIESADDFILSSTTTITHATFTGLLASGAQVSNVSLVGVQLYRVFPLDSVSPPSGNVPTRVDSPSDNAFDSRDSVAGNLTFTVSVLGLNFSVLNTVVDGINKSPSQTTGGEGPATGTEVRFDVTFTTPLVLPAGHYFVRPSIGLSSGNFFWLSAPKPIVSPGTPFTPDFQSWIRNTNLNPDWLRIGTDIVGGSPAPTFNGTFSLSGTAAVILGPLNDTGQTLCDDGRSTGTMVTCTTGNTGDASALPRQDGRFGRDVASLTKTGGGAAGFDFSKMCFNGDLQGAGTCTGALVANNSATATVTPGTDWACTKDNVTNLIWSLQSGNGDWTTYAQTTLPAATNLASRCGFNSSWRLPTLRELQSLVHHGLSVGPMIDTNYFPGTAMNAYFTSDTYLPFPSAAWAVNFVYGPTYTADKGTTSYAVRLVRSGL